MSLSQSQCCVTKTKTSPVWCGSCAPCPTMALVQRDCCRSNTERPRVYPKSCSPPCCPLPSNTIVYDQPIKTYRDSSCCSTLFSKKCTKISKECCKCITPSPLKVLTPSEICEKPSRRYKRSADYRKQHASVC